MTAACPAYAAVAAAAAATAGAAAGARLPHQRSAADAGARAGDGWSVAGGVADDSVGVQALLVASAAAAALPA